MGQIDAKKTGIKLREHRKAAGLLQKDLGRMIGIDPSSISIWERGVRIPSVDNLVILSKIYNVHIEDLIGEDDEEEKNDLYQSKRV